MAQGTQLDPYQSRVSAQDVMPRKTLPQMSGDSIASGLANIGSALETKERADGTTYAADQLSALRERQFKAYLDAQGSAKPDAQGFTGDYLKGFDDDAAQLAKASEGNRFAAPVVAAGIRQMRDQMGRSAMAFEAQTRIGYRKASVQQNADKMSAIVEQDPTQYEAAGAPIMEQVHNSGFDPLTRLELARNVDATLSLAASRGLAKQDPDAVLHQIEHPEEATGAIAALSPEAREKIQQVARQQRAGNIADSIVNTYRAAGPVEGARAYATIDSANLPDEDKALVRAHVQSGLAQRQAEARQINAQSIMGFEERYATGNFKPGDRGLLWDLYHKGAFGAEETAAKLGYMDRVAEASAASGGNLVAIQNAYKDRQPLDPEKKENKQGVDALFSAMATGKDPGSPEWVNTGADIALRTGVVPESMVSWSRANLVSGDPKSAVSAANALIRAEEASPRGSPFAVDSKLRALSHQIVDMTKAGTDPVRAVDVARRNTSISDPQQTALADAYRALKPDQSAESALRGLLSKAGGYNTEKGFIYDSVGKLPTPMVGEFNALTREYYTYTGGNLAQARGLAAADLQRTWGVSQVNGKPEVMKFAPENMFPGLQAEHVRADLETVAKNEGIADPATVRLVESSETGSTGGQTWFLGVPGKTGAYELLLGKNGAPRQYQLPIGKEDFEATRQQLIDKRIRDARKARDELHTQEAMMRDHLAEGTGVPQFWFDSGDSSAATP